MKKLSTLFAFALSFVASIAAPVSASAEPTPNTASVPVGDSIQLVPGGVYTLMVPLAKITFTNVVSHQGIVNLAEVSTAYAVYVVNGEELEKRLITCQGWTTFLTAYARGATTVIGCEQRGQLVAK